MITKKLKKFFNNKKTFKIDNIDFNKVLVSKNEPYDINNVLKYFIGCNDNDIIRLLCLRLPQIVGYVKKFAKDTRMPFKTNNKQLLKNYNKIWEKVENLMKINFES